MASILKSVVALLLVFGSLAGAKDDDTLDSSKSFKTTRLQDIIFFVRSQPNSFHISRSELFTAHIAVQLAETDAAKRPEVVVMDELWFEWHLGYWAVIPNLHRLEEMYGDKLWVFLCEEDTRVDIFKLVELLQKYNPAKPLFLGRGLYDEPNPAFQLESRLFASPDFGAGTLLSMPLINRLVKMAKYWKSDGLILKNVQFEVAKLIWNGGKGLPLIHVPQLCTVAKEGCITHLSDRFVDCVPPIDEKDLFVAVKTSSKFHKSRVPAVKRTWGKETQDIEFFSDVGDPSIPTTDLGGANKSHCEGTRAILQSAAKRGPRRRPWLLIAQDNTVFNLRRLRKMLACYNSSEEVVLGDRFGYKVYTPLGFSFVAARGGMVFSRAAVQKLRELECEGKVEGDDMAIGKFMERRMQPVVHSMHFHKYLVESYSPNFLASRLHISFGKSKHDDGLKTYAFLTGENDSYNRRDEL